MGADCIPWIILDKTVCTPATRSCYSEAVAYMPHSYFANDYAAAYAEMLQDDATLPSRASLGLPDDAVVYSCSNQLYKYDPVTWRTWMRILQRVPGSVLWLLRFPPAGQPRLQAEAAACGVDPSRVIFTDVAPKPQHIARSALADVFLDTLACNAHTTGCDVLWSGCPMVTLPGERMASRVAASLCNATGLGAEMVVGSLQEYEDLAVELGLNAAKRCALRDRLKAARRTAPLFDTTRWVGNLDRLLLRMWEVHVEGRGPHDFEIGEGEERPGGDTPESLQKKQKMRSA